MHYGPYYDLLSSKLALSPKKKKNPAWFACHPTRTERHENLLSKKQPTWEVTHTEHYWRRQAH